MTPISISREPIIQGPQELFNTVNRHVSNMRPCQVARAVNLAANIALTALGILLGGFLGTVAVGTGIVFSYFSYNNYQVLTNMRNIAENPLPTASTAVVDTITNWFTSNETPNVEFFALKRNTLFFDWAVENILSNFKTIQTLDMPRHLEMALDTADRKTPQCYRDLIDAAKIWDLSRSY